MVLYSPQISPLHPWPYSCLGATYDSDYDSSLLSPLTTADRSPRFRDRSLKFCSSRICHRRRCWDRRSFPSRLCCLRQIFWSLSEEDQSVGLNLMNQKTRRSRLLRPKQQQWWNHRPVHGPANMIRQRPPPKVVVQQSKRADRK